MQRIPFLHQELALGKKFSKCYKYGGTAFFAQATPGGWGGDAIFFHARNFFPPPPCSRVQKLQIIKTPPCASSRSAASPFEMLSASAISQISGPSSSQARLGNTISAILTVRNKRAGNNQYNTGEFYHLTVVARPSLWQFQMLTTPRGRFAGGGFTNSFSPHPPPPPPPGNGASDQQSGEGRGGIAS